MQQRARPRGRRIVAVAAVGAVLAVVACSATGPVAANTSTANTSAAPTVTGPKAVTSRAAPATNSGTIPGCRVGVWAEKVTDAGRVDWRVSLPFDASLGSGSQPPPLAVGGLSLFTVGDTLYALRLSDGRRAWHWGLPAPESPRPGVVVLKTVNTVDGLWTWHGSVIALADAATPSLVSLNPATGAVRWRAGLGPAALRFGTVWLSSDGVAAAVTGTQGRTLTAIDLATGRRLWSRTFPNTPIPVAEGTTFVLAANGSGTLAGLHARTGATQWSRTGFPDHTDILAAPGGPVLVDGIAGPPTGPVPGGPATLPVHPLIALSAATGKTLWQLRTQEDVSALWPQGSQLVIASDVGGGTSYVGDPGARLALVGLATGRVRWSAAELTDPSDPALIAPDGDVLSFTTLPGHGTLVDRSARTGATRWTVPPGGSFLAAPQGPNVLVILRGTPTGQPSRLLAIDEATGTTAATDLLPYTAAPSSSAPASSSSASPNPITVIGGDALLEPEQDSCTVPGTLGMAGH